VRQCRSCRCLPGLGIGFLGVALAFGLTLLIMAFAIGQISGCHTNPTVSVSLVDEVVMTFMFLMVILGATDERAPKGFAPIPIGLVLTLIHLISIPVTNTSVNPARSTGPAIFVGGWALGQLWLFWVAPILGAAIAGVVYRWLGSKE
jgi:glycerol uptake facilitator-like aquaporin